MDKERLKKEILFRSRRGLKETDLLLAGFFANDKLDTLSDNDLVALVALLECFDPDLLQWFFEDVPPPAEHLYMVNMIKQSKNKC